MTGSESSHTRWLRLSAPKRPRFATVVHSNTKPAAATAPNSSDTGFSLDSHDRLPILVTGVSGVAGYSLFYELKRRFGNQVLGTRPEKTFRLVGDGIVGTNLSEPDNVRRLIDEHGVRTIVNCGGSCHLKGCELDHEMAMRVNVSCVENLLEAMKGTPVRLVHLSIDLVFSGNGDGRYVETDTPDPVTMYGKTMVMAEQLILERRPESAILRISLPMGISFNGHAGAIDWIQHRFAKNLPATLYYDEVRSPTYVDCMNRVIEEFCCRTDLSGIWHAGGDIYLSLYQIAQIVNRVGGYDPGLLHGCPRIEAGPIPPRAGNVTMNSDKLKQALGRQPFLPWPLQPDFLPTDRLWHSVRNPSVNGSPELIQQRLYRPGQSSAEA